MRLEYEETRKGVKEEEVSSINSCKKMKKLTLNIRRGVFPVKKKGWVDVNLGCRNVQDRMHFMK